ncbi:hypothetical protein SteCoe_33285 [Stentor coeruleus]|uniref:mitogen-activated protein kinase kinase n=1 Tax=Stentor coeruleus TaxID=5963 RepID=A0A1R2AXB6_9CILI|nr:hypothetical protein SteCoe_33285 [Stentor coeruleus]
MYENLEKVDFVTKESMKHCKIMKHRESNEVYFVKRVKLIGSNMKTLATRNMCFSLTINNPHLVKLHEVNEYKDKYQFIYDYYPGGNLKNEIHNRTSENPIRYWERNQLLKIWSNLINGLQLLEVYQCAHRDIRPENIIKCTEEDYKFTNFHNVYDYWNREDQDYSRPFHTSILSLHVSKSVSFNENNFYYSPEALQNFSGNLESFNPIKSDVYSLGLVFLHMATLGPTMNFTSLKPEVIKKKIEEINYDSLIKKILLNMLIHNFERRPSFSAISKWINKNSKEIKVTNTNKKLKNERSSLALNMPAEKLKIQIPNFKTPRSYMKINYAKEEKKIENFNENDQDLKQKGFAVYDEEEKDSDSSKTERLSKQESNTSSPINKQKSNILPGKEVKMGFSSHLKMSPNKIENLEENKEKKPESENINIIIPEIELENVEKINSSKEKKCVVNKINDVEILEEIVSVVKNDNPSWNSIVKKCLISESNTIAAAKIYKITEEIIEAVNFERDLMEKCSFKPSFIGFYGSFIFQDDFYIILEYLPKSLYDFINDKTVDPLNEKESMNFTYYLLKGLKHLEKMKICHCDIKPGNILLTDDKKPKIIDFSSSRIYDENFKGKISIRGTVKYLAPEIIKEGRKNKRKPIIYDIKKADAFSLGVTLIETYLKKNTDGLGLVVNKSELEEDIQSIPWDWAKKIVKKLVFERICMIDAYELICMQTEGSLSTIH